MKQGEIAGSWDLRCKEHSSSRRSVLRLLGGLLPYAGLLFRSPARAHKFHFSNTQVDYNKDASSFEITIRLFADDLEQVLARRAGRKVEVDRTPDAEALAFSYLREVLRLRGPDMQEIPLRWVGMEAKVDTVYCYVEAPAPATGLRNLAMAFSLFFELQRGQVNLVSFRDPVHGRPRDLMFRAGDRFKVIIFPDPEAAASGDP